MFATIYVIFRVGSALPVANPWPILAPLASDTAALCRQETTPTEYGPGQQCAWRAPLGADEPARNHQKRHIERQGLGGDKV
jgi:hypothetical protein